MLQINTAQRRSYDFHRYEPSAVKRRAAKKLALGSVIKRKRIDLEQKLSVLALDQLVERPALNEFSIRQQGESDFFVIRDFGGVTEVQHRANVEQGDVYQDGIVLERETGFTPLRLAAWARRVLQDPMRGLEDEVFGDLRSSERYGTMIAPATAA